MTPREVGVFIDGVVWRMDQEMRQRKRQAWHTAMLQRAKKLPSFKSFMRERPTRVDKSSPEEQAAFFYDFAERANLKVVRHATPVLPPGAVPGTVYVG